MSGYTGPEAPEQDQTPPAPAGKRQSDRSLRWLLAIINLPWLILLVVWLITRH